MRNFKLFFISPFSILISITYASYAVDHRREVWSDTGYPLGVGARPSKPAFFERTLRSRLHQVLLACGSKVLYFVLSPVFARPGNRRQKDGSSAPPKAIYGAGMHRVTPVI